MSPRYTRDQAVADAHDGDGCADVDRQLDDAHGELNDISMWLARRGVNLRREDGTYDFGAACDELVARAAIDKDSGGPMTSSAAPECTDVYVRFTDLPVARGRRIGMAAEEVNLDLDEAGRPVGIEILDPATVEVTVNGVTVTHPQEPLHEVQCPACGATIRARMADAPPTLAETRTGLSHG